MIRPPPRSPLFPYTTPFRSFLVPRSSTPPLADHPTPGVTVTECRGAHAIWSIKKVRAHTHRRDGKAGAPGRAHHRSEEHTSELQSRQYLVCRLLLEKKKI